MKVGLIGFGKTGKAVATVLLHDKSMNLRWVIRKSDLLEHRSVPEFLGVESDEPGLIYSASEFTASELLEKSPVDVIIDFSGESGLDYYGESAALKGVTIVSAISKYDYQRQHKLKTLSNSTRVVWSPNITIGINFLLLAAKTLQSIAPYTDIQILEEHFRTKPEVSGTAIRIAETLDLEKSDIKTIRAGGIIGNHEILFGFPFQTVRLRHESITREAFGNGAIFAAKEVQTKPFGIYGMEDLLMPFFADQHKLDSVPRETSNWLRNRLARTLHHLAKLVDPVER
jgi:4-hydroxy-tetrahydrodipicolinate reductase